MATSVVASRKHVELSLELKRKLIQEHEHGVPFTLLGKKYHIATSTAANIWRKKDFFLRSRMSGSRKRCNDRSKYKIVNQVTALFVKSMLERNHKIDGEVIKRFARTAAAQCNFKDFHGSNGWLDSFKKRENVCWVRRRGGGSGAAQERHVRVAALGALEQLDAASGSAPAMILAAPGGGAAALEQRRSDSPNLSTAAAAAAVAATAAAEHHHHHHQAANSGGAGHQLAASNQEANAAREQHCHSPSSSSAASHCCFEEESCPRCTVAAAAAAIAALNSSDSTHERDHEIEDWFHGIPFLCQFFEEYQSMHQGEGSNGAGGLVGSSSAAASGPQASCNSSSASGGRAGHHAQLMQQQQPQHHQHGASFGSSAAASPPQSCSSSSSSSQLIHMSSSSASVPMLCSAAAASMQQSDQLLNNSHAFPHQHQPNQVVRSHSTASSPSTASTTAASGGFRPSVSLADIQMLEQKHIFAEHQQLQRSSISSEMLDSVMGPGQLKAEHMFDVGSSEHLAEQQQQQQANYQQSVEGFSEQVGSQEHSMEISYTDSAPIASSAASQQQQQRAQQLINCLVPGSTRTTSGASSDSATARSSATMVANDYNSSDNDQEFYIPLASQQQQQQYISHNARSQDELLSAYQEEMSEHADHCCHYEQPAAVQLALPTSGGAGHQRQAREQQALVAQYQQQESGLEASESLAHCYMDEYEYENVSTIRHYPLPPLVHSAQFSAALATNGAPADERQAQPFANAADPEQRAEGQQRSRQSMGDCRQALAQQAMSSSFASSISAQQQQQQALSNSSSSSSSQLATNVAFAAGETNFQAQQQDYDGSLLLYDHEQTIEHADHEEHNLLHNALMRSPEKLKLIDSIITLLNYASNYNQKMLAPLLEIKRCIERDLEVVLSDTSAAVAAAAATASATVAPPTASAQGPTVPVSTSSTSSSSSSSSSSSTTTPTTSSSSGSHCCDHRSASAIGSSDESASANSTSDLVLETIPTGATSRMHHLQQGQQVVVDSLRRKQQQQHMTGRRGSSVISSPQHNLQVDCSNVNRQAMAISQQSQLAVVEMHCNNNTNNEMLEIEC